MKSRSQIEAKHTQRAEEILNSGNDREILRLLREETLHIVLMVRVRNQERQEEWEARQEIINPMDLFMTEFEQAPNV